MSPKKAPRTKQEARRRARRSLTVGEAVLGLAVVCGLAQALRPYESPASAYERGWRDGRVSALDEAHEALRGLDE